MNDPHSAESTCAWLRVQTREYHLAAERAMNLTRRLQTVPTYVELLQQLWVLYAGFEIGLSRFDWASIEIDFVSRRRSHWLAKDIVALGGTPSDPAPIFLDARTLDEALGAMYVIEGSSLGGQIIMRQAIKLLGVTPQAGARFFHGHGESTVSLWKGFTASLDRYSEKITSLRGIERGAIRAFAEFIVALQR